MNNLKPITRTEHFMGRAAGNPGAEKLTPITREEHFLEDIAEAVETGVTPGSVVSATAAMTPEQAAQTRQNIGADTPETVTEWLNDHVNPETGYVIDNSLTIEGAAADAKATGDAVGELKSALDEVTDATTNPIKHTINKTSTGVVEYGTRGYYNSSGNFVSSNSYVMYYFEMPKTESTWIEVIGSNDYCQLNVFSDTLFGTSILFARSSQSNLPTENNKATILGGYIVSIVITVSGTEYRDFNLDYYEGRQIKTDKTLLLEGVPADSKTVGDLLLPIANAKKQCCIYRPVQHQEGNPNLDNQIYYSDKVTGNVLSVFYPAKYGYIQFNLGESYRDIEGGYDVWRMCVMYAADDAFAKRFEITRPGEWEMAVKIRGAEDFIGGYEHGDEYQSEYAVYIDGEKIDVSNLSVRTYFNELKIRVVSNMYNPDDHETLVGIHGKEWIFSDGKVTLNQSIQWLFAEDTEMTMSYLAMFPAIRGNDSVSDIQITSKFYDNVDFTERSCAVYGFTGEMNTDTTKVTLYSPESGFDMSLEVLDYPNYPDSRYVFLSNNENKANKIYFGVCGKGATYGTVTPNQIWKSKAVYTFNMVDGTQFVD